MSEFTEWLGTETKEIAAAIAEFDVDLEYDKILEWCAANKKLSVYWANEFVDGHENVRIDEEHAHWAFSWQYGHIGFDGLKKEDEEKAKKATALFIYLWSKGVSAPIAERCAASYVLTYTVGKV